MAFKGLGNAATALQLARENRAAAEDVQMGIPYAAGVPKARMAGDAFLPKKQGAGAEFYQEASDPANKGYFRAFADRLSNSLADQQPGMV